MGKMEKVLIRQSADSGIDLPDRVKNAPYLTMGLELFYNAFHELSSCRQIGMGGIGPIPWTAMNDYCITNEIDGEQRQDFLELITKLDSEYRDYIEKKADKKRGEGPKKGGKTPPKKRRKR